MFPARVVPEKNSKSVVARNYSHLNLYAYLKLKPAFLNASHRLR